MQISDFVHSALSQILAGVRAAQQHPGQQAGGNKSLADSDPSAVGVVAPPCFLPDSGPVNMLYTGAEKPFAIAVDFDLAVTVSTEHGKEGKLGVVAWGIGGSADSRHASESVSRIRFSVPVVLPVPPGLNPSSQAESD